MLAAPLLIISAAFDNAWGIMGIEEAPVPPNTEPKMKTFGVPLVVALISSCRKFFKSFPVLERAASTIEWYIIIEPK